MAYEQIYRILLPLLVLDVELGIYVNKLLVCAVSCYLSKYEYICIHRYVYMFTEHLICVDM